MLFIIGFALIIATIVIWILSLIGLFFGFPILNALTPTQPIVTILAILNIVILIGVPVISLALLFGRLIFKTRYNIKWNKGLWILWSLNIVSIFFIGSIIGRQFSVEKTVEAYNQEFSIDQDKLLITAAKNPYIDTWIRINGLAITNDEIASEHIEVNIHKAKDDVFEITQEYQSRGENITHATQTASSIRHNFDLENNQLTLNPYFVINKGEKWRAQKSIINLYVPEGKSVQFDKLPDYILERIHINNASKARHLHNGEVWQLTKRGFKNLDGHKNRKVSPHKDYEDFHTLDIKGKMKVNIKQSEAYSIEIDGKEKYVNKVKINQQNERIEISSDLERTSSPIRLNISLPSLSKLFVSQTDDIRIDGFEQKKMFIKSSGESRAEIKANLEVEQLELDLNSRIGIDLRGEGDNIIINLKDRAALDAERFGVKTANVHLSDRSSAFLEVSDTLTQSLQDRAKLRVQGEPVVVNE